VREFIAEISILNGVSATRGFKRASNICSAFGYLHTGSLGETTIADLYETVDTLNHAVALRESPRLKAGDLKHTKSTSFIEAG